jgi:uncharacterized membrane protein YhdT
MNDLAIKTIGKYALILSIFYVLEFITGHFIGQLVKDTTDYEMNNYFMTGNIILPYLLNIIVAFIIYSDKNRLEIEGKYSVLLTIIYRPVGIVLFLIYVIDKEIKKDQYAPHRSSL